MSQDRGQPGGRLLIATDLSPRADRALERALALAAAQHCGLSIVHVVDEDLPAALADRHRQGAELALREQLGSLPAAAELDIDVAVLFGKDYQTILRVSEQVDAPAIVLGTHRHEGLPGMFRGTTVERVIRAGNLPCLVVKQRVGGPYDRALVGIDFSVYSRRAVEFAVAFLPDCKLTLVHAYQIPYRGFLYGASKELSKRQEQQFLKIVEDEFSAFLAPLDGTIRRLDRVMQEGPARQVLHAQIERLNPDLVIVGTHGRTGVAHAFLGSVAEDLLSHPPCDVLAVKAW